jgi:hypothetical protein
MYRALQTPDYLERDQDKSSIKILVKREGNFSLFFTYEYINP